MKLSLRLQAIANFVPVNSIVADIGTDHGYIPIYLIKEKIAKKVIASDLSSKSLDKVINNVAIRNLEDKIDCRWGDGLEVIKPFEVDTLIVSGVGGPLIRNILDKDKFKRDSITNFILQANVGTDGLRRYLYDSNFQIIDEKLVKEEGRFYEIIYAKKGKFFIENPIYFTIGIKLVENQNPLLEKFINHNIKESERILASLPNTGGQKIRERKIELMEKINSLKVVLKSIEGKGDNEING